MSGLDLRSKELRRLVVQMVESDRRGHLGPAMSLMEILRVLYDSFLRPKQDRFILSKGHGCLALYAILADKGYFDKDLLKSFCKPNSPLGGHPERHKLPGIEASTGALGHGLPMGVGMALAARIRGLDTRVVVVTGDGELNEGSIWEAALSASKHKLSNLSVFVDYNKLQSYGSTREVLDLEPLSAKWSSFGFEVAEVDGHHVDDLENLLKQIPMNSQKPTAIICHTTKGKGFYFAENNVDWHHKSGLTDQEIGLMYQCLE